MGEQIASLAHQTTINIILGEARVIKNGETLSQVLAEITNVLQ